VTVNIDTMKKDLSEMLEEARLLGWSAPATEGALRGFASASSAGLGDKDCVMLPAFWSAQPRQ
jgi:3-hydroxyisobutyrate dehydrogenase-like beta-hydroxyacid dehydrogenase